MFPRCYGGHSATVGTPSGKRGDWGWDYRVLVFAANNRRTTVTECCVLKALFSLVWRSKMSSVFGTGQSMNCMAWKLVKRAKFVLVLTNTHMLKNQESSGTECQKYGGPQLSQQKNHPNGKKKNLMAKRITTTSQQKKSKLIWPLGIEEVLPWVVFFLPWGFSFCHESFSFCRESFFLFSFCRGVNAFAVTVVGHLTKVRQTTSNWIVRILY